jgi:hypothetical protein
MVWRFLLPAVRGLRAARTGAVLWGLLSAGCTALNGAPPTPSVPGGAAPAGEAVVDPAARPATPVASATVGAGIAKSPAPAAAATSAPVAKASAKAPSAVPAPPAGKPPSAAPSLAKPSTPTLDLASLEKRLRESNAIGVVTKITLKNQVDDLLDQFRAFYRGGQKTTPSALRQPYDRLLMKVLALLQDSDPQLASAISASREAIWGILSDPVKFSAI